MLRIYFGLCSSITLLWLALVFLIRIGKLFCYTLFEDVRDGDVEEVLSEYGGDEGGKGLLSIDGGGGGAEGLLSIFVDVDWCIDSWLL